METRIVNKNKKDKMIDVIKNRKETAYYREGSYITEIILGKTKFIFPNSKMNNGMWIFRSVMLSAQKYVNVNIIENKSLPNAYEMIDRYQPKISKNNYKKIFLIIINVTFRRY